MMNLFFFLSILSFLASIHFLVSIKKPGVYPPKYMLKKRSVAMAAGGLIFFLIGCIVSLFH
ncbi:hypothetical protein F4V44_00990 [Niallia endozanthoxylica]|uniref:Uncharacterized protein n=1 Tax=Niallia endozanthoxylica TaxID=2036016 RepID=A0A5J5IAH7_9BACI|nr:hypothetical protein F4V44_00990 [Niallia endozanthoxylica]